MDNLAYDESKERRRYELIGGETVMLAKPRISHANVAGNLYGKIWSYLRGKRCKVFFEPDVHLDEANHLIPDIAIVCDKSILKATRICGTPDFIGEVLSPRTAKEDRGRKKDAYERAGVKEYWLLDPAAKTIEAYRLREGKLVLEEVLHVYPEDELEEMDEEDKAELRMSLKLALYDDLEIDIREVFEDL